MTRARLITWALAAIIAFILSSACLLDGPDDIATAQAVADDLYSITKETK